MEICNFLTFKLYLKGSSKDSDHVFSYLLQFLRALRTHLFYRKFIMDARETGRKQISNIKVKVSVFNTFLSIHTFSMRVFKVVGAVANLWMSQLNAKKQAYC